MGVNFRKFFCLAFGWFCVYEKVKICKASKFLLGPWCQEAEERRFLKWKKPTMVCSVCSAPKEPIVKCQFPYDKIGKIIGWSGTFYSGLVLTSLIESRMKDFYDQLALWCNAERNFSWYHEVSEPWAGKDIKPFIQRSDGKWDLTIPNEEYYAQLDRRLEMVAERQLTEIVSLVDFSGSVNAQNWPTNPLNGSNNVNNTEVIPSRLLAHEPSIAAFLGFVQTFVERTRKYLPYIIYEIGNEPGGDPVHLYNWYKRCIQKLIELGIPQEHIQIYWFDSSYFVSLIRDDFPGIISSIHGISSEKSIDDLCQGEFLRLLMPNGCYPCSDGSDWNKDAKGIEGIYWKGDYRRPNEDQIRYILSRTLAHGGKGFEHLSGFCCLDDELPDLDDAINLGRLERWKLYCAWLNAS